MLNPSIGLNLGLSGNPSSYNYAYIPTFNRYYFVREWTFQNALWWATLEVDPLASWKAEIGSSTCYVLRSSADFDGTVCDTTYPGTGVTSMIENQAESPWLTDTVQDGVFVVGVAGQSTTYYIFTYDVLQLFFQYLFSDLYADELTDNWTTVYPQLKAQVNPLQYITSIMWMPFIATATPVDTIRVGWVDVPTNAWRVDGSGIRYGQQTWFLNRHPQAASRGSYLNNAPFSNYMLFYPPWGTITLDPDVMANSESITAVWGIDLRTGQGTLTIAGGEIHIMSWVHSQVGLPYQVSQVLNRGYGIGNMIAPAISTAANILAGNYAGAGSTVASEIGNFAASKIPSATTIGSNGGIDTLRGMPTLQYEFKLVTDEDNVNRGRPLCTTRQISTLGGYTKVANAYIDIPATQAEKNAIISYMEGGFFYD